MYGKLMELKYKGEKFDRVAFFCHGYPKKFDAGFNVNDIFNLAELLKDITHEESMIMLFCCKTGKLVDGLAARLSDLCNLPVIAHRTRGHTTRNPFKSIFVDGEIYELNPPVKSKDFKSYKEMMKSNPFLLTESIVFEREFLL